MPAAGSVKKGLKKSALRKAAANNKKAPTKPPLRALPLTPESWATESDDSMPGLEAVYGPVPGLESATSGDERRRGG
eukprot:gene9147-1480_t